MSILDKMKKAAYRTEVKTFYRVFKKAVDELDGRLPEHFDDLPPDVQDQLLNGYERLRGEGGNTAQAEDTSPPPSSGTP